MFNCNHCNKEFNRKDNKDKHEKNFSCNSKIIIEKYNFLLLQYNNKDNELMNETITKNKVNKDINKLLEENKKLLEENKKLLDHINNSIDYNLLEEINELKQQIKQKDEIIKFKENTIENIDIAYENIIQENLQLRNDLNNFKIDYNNLKIGHVVKDDNTLIDYNKINNFLHHYDIEMIIDIDKLTNFLLDLFKNKLTLLNDTTITYIEKLEEINYYDHINNTNKNVIIDKNCSNFICNCVLKLLKKNNEIYDKTDFLDLKIEKKVYDNKKILQDIGCKKNNYINSFIFKQISKKILLDIT